MATRLRDRLTGWPPELEVFDLEDWGPVPGATLESCRCAGCAERWGPQLPADDSTSVEDARRRWREARIAHLRERLGKDDRLYKFEVLESLRERWASRDGRPSGDTDLAVLVAVR